MAYAWPIWDVQEFGPPLTCKAYRWRLPQKSGLRPSIRVFSEWTELRPVYQFFPLLTQRESSLAGRSCYRSCLPRISGPYCCDTCGSTSTNLSQFQKAQEGEVNSYGWRLSSLSLPRFPCFLYPTERLFPEPRGPPGALWPSWSTPTLW